VDDFALQRAEDQYVLAGRNVEVVVQDDPSSSSGLPLPLPKPPAGGRSNAQTSRGHGAAPGEQLDGAQPAGRDDQAPMHMQALLIHLDRSPARSGEQTRW
jgi:hypothetical protein